MERSIPELLKLKSLEYRRISYVLPITA